VSKHKVLKNRILAIFSLTLFLHFVHLTQEIFTGFTIPGINTFFVLSYGPILYSYAFVVNRDQLPENLTRLFIFPLAMGVLYAFFTPKIYSSTDFRLFMNFVTVGYTLFFWFLIMRIKHTRNSFDKTIQNQSVWVNGLSQAFMINFLIYFIPFMVNLYVPVFGDFYISLFLFSMIALTASISIVGMIYPEIIRDNSEFRKYKGSKMNRTQATTIYKSICDIVKDQSLFEDPNFSIENLSKTSEFPKHQISQVLNVVYNINFYDFINSFRVERAKVLLMQSKEDYRINEVMYSVGFNSKSTFNKIFKKETGMTPSQFREFHSQEVFNY
jgi:AraC-like DNA-binding protein